MRHRVDGRKFGRNTSHRLAMLRNLVANLIIHEKLITTVAKAKELRRVAEKLVTRAKGVDSGKGKMTKKRKIQRLMVYREIKKYLPMEAYDNEGLSVNLAGKLIDEIAPRYMERKGGYTRIFRIGNRKGDNAPLCLIELLPATKREEKEEKEEKEKKKSRKSIFSSKSKKETLET